MSLASSVRVVGQGLEEGNIFNFLRYKTSKEKKLSGGDLDLIMMEKQ